jgi:hypothetical protein
VDCLADTDCDDGNDCTVDTCDLSAGLCSNLPDFDNVLIATGQEFDGNSQVVEVTFGLDDGAGSGIPADPDNWSRDDIVQLLLIGDTDPNMWVVDLRPSDSLVLPVAWPVMVEIGDAADSNQPAYYPVLSWELSGSLCAEFDGNDCVYELISGLDIGGTVLANMTDTNSYQTVSQDGDPDQYFTILMTCEAPEPEPEPEPEPKPTRPSYIYPYPGVYPGAVGWGGLPFSLGFRGGLPFPMTSGFAPGLSIPSFPGTYLGFTYPGSYAPWTSPAFTPYVPRFPVTFPTLGLFSPFGRFGWTQNYWTGYPRTFPYQSGWFNTFR